MSVAQIDTTVANRALVNPREKVTDAIWLIVVCAFVIVLVGSFATLAILLFIPAKNLAVTPEIVLSIFTSVVGFLAGLFVPSPGDRA